ncbi:MAG: MFS transporter [Thermoplasmata archaeon]|jgi:MFS family permease
MNAPSPRSALSALMIRGPRGAFRWTAFVLAVTSLMAATPTPLYPVYERLFGFSSGTLGIVFGAYTLGVLLTLFLVAPMAERVGRKKLLYLAMALTALGALVFAFANGVLWLTLGRAICGLGVGATSSVATAAMSDLEPRHDQHHVARVAVAANFGGFAVGVAVSGVVVEFAPYPTHLAYLLPLVACALGFFAVSVTPETATALGVKTGAAIQRIAVPEALRRPFWVAAIGIAACYSIYGLFAALIPSYVRVGLGIESPLVAGSIVALMFGTAALVQLATPRIRDRRALLLGFPLLLGSLIALVVFLPLTQLLLILLVSAGLGGAVGLTFMGSTTLVDRIAPEGERGEMLAGFYAAGYLALAVPTIGVAEASESIGLTAAGVLFGSILAVAVAVLYAVTYRTPTPAGGEGRPRGSAGDP